MEFRRGCRKLYNCHESKFCTESKRLNLGSISWKRYNCHSLFVEKISDKTDVAWNQSYDVNRKHIDTARHNTVIL